MGDPRRTSKGAAKVERSIVLYVLHTGSSRSRTEIASALSDTPAILLEKALTRLETQGVITLSGETIQAAPSLRQLSLLGMIAI